MLSTVQLFDVEVAIRVMIANHEKKIEIYKASDRDFSAFINYFTTKNAILTESLSNIKSACSPENAKKQSRMESLVKELSDALRLMMEAEGGEPGDTSDQQEAWERAESVLAKCDEMTTAVRP